MKKIAVVLLLLSFGAHAAQRIQCTAKDYQVLVESNGPTDIKVVYKGEVVFADGYMDSESVDLVARFSSIGEMTLFAKIGKTTPDNYIFIQGKRISVVCR